MRFGFDTVLRVAPYAASKNAPDHVQRLIGKYVTFPDFRDFLGVSMQDEEYTSRFSWSIFPPNYSGMPIPFFQDRCSPLIRMVDVVVLAAKKW